jgi:beta-lactam-binding protein with PASTA domain
MALLDKGLSALGRLGLLIALLAVFIGSMAGVVYMSLSGEEIKVPELVGKDFVESERELAALGLKLKRRADRPSTEKMNTVLEQLPKAGETVKTGQLILVVTSKAGVDADTPKSLIEDIQADDSEKIEEMISDKPKKAKPSTNSNKKVADTKRDVIANTASGTSDANKSLDPEKPKTDDTPKPGEPKPATKGRETTPKPSAKATP